MHFTSIYRRISQKNIALCTMIQQIQANVKVEKYMFCSICNCIYKFIITVACIFEKNWLRLAYLFGQIELNCKILLRRLGISQWLGWKRATTILQLANFFRKS